MMLDAPRLLVDHRSAAGPTLRRVRGSLLVSSLQSLRELELFPRYLAHLPAPVHDDVLFTLATSWVSCDLAMQHYGACDGMELDEGELDAVGKHVANRIMGTFVATLVRGSRSVGANMRPVIVLQNYHRLWDRLLEGGSCKTQLTGMKDAVVESRGVPMFRYRYFRMAYVGLIRGAGLAFGRALFTKVQRTTDDSMTIAISWV